MIEQTSWCREAEKTYIVLLFVFVFIIFFSFILFGSMCICIYIYMKGNIKFFAVVGLQVVKEVSQLFKFLFWSIRRFRPVNDTATRKILFLVVHRII